MLTRSVSHVSVIQTRSVLLSSTKQITSSIFGASDMVLVSVKLGTNSDFRGCNSAKGTLVKLLKLILVKWFLDLKA